MEETVRSGGTTRRQRPRRIDTTGPLARIRENERGPRRPVRLVVAVQVPGRAQVVELVHLVARLAVEAAPAEVGEEHRRLRVDGAERTRWDLWVGPQLNCPVVRHGTVGRDGED